MPHMSSGGSEDFFSKDEVKVYKDEGEEEKRSSENLSEEKLGLVTESEEGKNGSIQGNYSGNDKSSGGGNEEDKGGSVQPHGPMGFFMPHFPAYPNGASMGKLGMPPYPGFMMYNDYASPPPAHMGIPPVTTDPKTGLPRPPLYAAYPPGQFHHLYGPDLSQWHRPTGYPISSGAFSSSYPPLLNTTISRFGPPGMMPHGIQPGMPHPAIISPGPKQDILPHHMSQDHHRQGSDNGLNHSHHQPPPEPEKKKPHIKKPLNAFMLFMKEMRPTVIAECTLRESAAINQILGRRWHALDRSEQSKYYEMARKEKELHLQLYPGWSARDNYAIQTKKKKRKKTDPIDKNRECPNAKKCRARFGMDQQTNWCKPCRRKKKCIYFMRGEDGGSNTDEEGYSEFCDSGRSAHDSDSNIDSPRPSSHGGDDFSHSDLCHDSQQLSPIVDEMEQDDVSNFSIKSSLCNLVSNVGPPVPSASPSVQAT
ncbi:protein pangolin, isoforms A/H/I/S isoform X2 [Patella vulgata]|uniref:protein pangolin, isoforms A/H/I/S isoform X2 n=1 Tax=Patella vulgata TaxID=6465 RepID=UPI00217FBC74|nr:protein pangolin, isoforms A/H/I/S isoform X2 [Patella vulgata]